MSNKTGIIIFVLLITLALGFNIRDTHAAPPETKGNVAMMFNAFQIHLKEAPEAITVGGLGPSIPNKVLLSCIEFKLYSRPPATKCHGITEGDGSSSLICEAEES